MKSWSSFAMGLVVGIVLTAGVFLLKGRERGHPELSGVAVSAQKLDAKAAGGGEVIINGTALTRRHEEEFRQRYGVAPVAGNS